MYKIAVYVTAYQDVEALQACIGAIQHQSYPVSFIYIVDNSPQPLLDSKVSENIIINHHPENIGISGGLNIALKWAIQQEYDFLWTFDQDSQPLPDVLEKLVNSYATLVKQGERIGVIAPLPVDIVTGQKWHGIIFDKYQFVESPLSQEDANIYECDAVITSGSLVSLPAAKNTDLPDEGFFIDAVDWEYCLKFRNNDYKIYVVKDAILEHRFGNSRPPQTIFRKIKFTIYDYSPLRYYYICRNYTFVETRLVENQYYLARSILNRFKFIVIILIKIIFYEKSQISLKVWACFKGTYHGFIGKLGKTWQT